MAFVCVKHEYPEYPGYNTNMEAMYSSNAYQIAFLVSLDMVRYHKSGAMVELYRVSAG